MPTPESTVPGKEPLQVKKTSARWFWGGGALLGIGICSIASVPLLRTNAPKVNADPVIPVSVTKVVREDLSRDLVIAAEFRPYQEIDVHAKVSGYIQSISVDVGDRVKQGQALATLEVPELGDELANVSASVKRSEEEAARAQAAYAETHLAFSRLSSVAKEKPDLVAQQDIDDAQSRDTMAGATMTAAQDHIREATANENKIKTMIAYTRIAAPFDGVVTKRYADTGALIQAGTSSSTQSLPVVRLSENSRLRLVFPVPESAVAKINESDPVEVNVQSIARNFKGVISRFDRRVAAATRTMEAEVDVDNKDLRIIPGMYASVTLKLDRRHEVLVVPVEAVSRQNTSSVFLVNKDNRVEERQVKCGVETASRMEIVSGLEENDLVVVGGRNRVLPGEKVEPKLSQAAIN